MRPRRRSLTLPRPRRHSLSSLRLVQASKPFPFPQNQESSVLETRDKLDQSLSQSQESRWPGAWA